VAIVIIIIIIISAGKRDGGEKWVSKVGKAAILLQCSLTQ
jgi:hypothetical protein